MNSHHANCLAMCLHGIKRCNPDMHYGRVRMTKFEERDGKEFYYGLPEGQRLYTIGFKRNILDHIRNVHHSIAIKFIADEKAGTWGLHECAVTKLS